MLEFLGLLLVTTTTTNNRQFKYIPYGENAPTDEITISCDGKVSGSTLELTHWTNNKTPDNLYADTSTEIALNFALDEVLQEQYNNALVLNNHFDSDGVLSAWTCLNPQEALKYKQLLIDSAEAGDFGEWSSDAGVKIDLTLNNMLGDMDDGQACLKALEMLPSILFDFQKNNGNSYKQEWESEWEEICHDWEVIHRDPNILTKGPGKIVLVQEPQDNCLSTYAVHKGLRTQNKLSSVNRILRATSSNNGWSYKYETPGHGWVKKLKTRREICQANKNLIVEKLNSDSINTKSWVVSSGLTSICKSSIIETNPETIMNVLVDTDQGAN